MNLTMEERHDQQKLSRSTFVRRSTALARCSPVNQNDQMTGRALHATSATNWSQPAANVDDAEHRPFKGLR